MCVLILCTTFIWNIFHSKNNSREAARYDRRHFHGTWIFSTHFPKNTQILNFMEIHPVVAELSRADVQTWQS
jgi:hypothetical protein